MSETLDQIELPNSCTIFVGGEAWKLTNLTILPPIGGMSFVRFTKPDGTTESMPLLNCFDINADGVLQAIAVGLGGINERVWNGLSSERRADYHDKEARLRRTVRKDLLSAFRG